MQSASFSIWICIAVSISYDNKIITPRAPIYLSIYLSIIIIIIIIIIIFYSLENFSHQRYRMVSHCSLSDAGLLKSQRLFSVFLSILLMLMSGWFLMVLLFSNLPVRLPNLWALPQVRQLRLASPSPSCSIVFFFNSLARSRHLSRCLFSINCFLLMFFYSAGLFLLIITRSGRLAKIRWSVYITKSQRSCVS